MLLAVTNVAAVADAFYRTPLAITDVAAAAFIAAVPDNHCCCHLCCHCRRDGTSLADIVADGTIIAGVTAALLPLPLLPTVPLMPMVPVADITAASVATAALAADATSITDAAPVADGPMAHQNWHFRDIGTMLQ
jgi:hypothetical protein